ncbi:MAG TPA: alpha/beta fold hydrolase, partial [Saprospiraceae bacterium]|nr:alpha/beta fold hydrolase [Saprospiraceae bacterium]
AVDISFAADGQAKPVVVFLHGFKGFKDWGCWNLMAAAFAEAGFVFVKFNASHNGVTIENPTEFADLEAFGHNTYSLELADLDTVLSWLTEGCSPVPADEMDVSRLALLGHSRGGGVVLVQSAMDERVKAVITLAAVSNLAFMWEGNPALELWKETGVTHILNARTGQQMPVYLDVYEDYQARQPQLNIADAMQRLTQPCLIIHGDADASIPVQAAHQLQAWNPASELLVLPGADHVFGAQNPWTEAELPPHTQQATEFAIAFLMDVLS